MPVFGCLWWGFGVFLVVFWWFLEMLAPATSSVRDGCGWGLDDDGGGDSGDGGGELMVMPVSVHTWSK